MTMLQLVYSNTLLLQFDLRGPYTNKKYTSTEERFNCTLQ